MIPPGLPGAFWASATVDSSRLNMILDQRHPPQRLAGRRTGGEERSRQVVVRAEQPSGTQAERDLHRTGEGGEIHYGRGPQPGDRVGERVGEDEAPLGVRVLHFRRPAAVVPNDVARAHRRAGQAVLGGGNEDSEPDRKSAGRNRL